MFGHDHTGTWQQAIDDWTTALQATNYSELTIRQRRWQLRKLHEAHPRISPFKLGTDDLHAWLAGHDWSSETRKSAVAALRSFYGWAVEQRRMKHDPAAGLKSRPVPRRFPRPAADAVLERALSGADDRLRLMLVLAAHAGLRVSEIAGLRWADVDDDWMIVRGKNDKERRVPLVPVVAAELADEYSRRLAGRVGSGFSGFRYDGGAITTYVFPGRHGGMNPTWVSQLLSKALGPGTTAHMLRHRAATRAGRTGDLAAVQELLGHTNPQTTRIYMRVDDAALRKAAEAI